MLEEEDEEKSESVQSLETGIGLRREATNEGNEKKGGEFQSVALPGSSTGAALRGWPVYWIPQKFLTTPRFERRQDHSLSTSRSPLPLRCAGFLSCFGSFASPAPSRKISRYTGSATNTCHRERLSIGYRDSVMKLRFWQIGAILLHCLGLCAISPSIFSSTYLFANDGSSSIFHDLYRHVELIVRLMFLTPRTMIIFWCNRRFQLLLYDEVFWKHEVSSFHVFFVSYRWEFVKIAKFVNVAKCR